ncbi:ABC transporter substrate-binding protein [Desulfatibacillum aliphaticivorans]|uniref:ABC transporter substrate-binding protein n=1 Tax=Desulfatibacillum aliphaticivorans TaxID=218208 RepID=UPI0004272F97|nr:ABC transporter substrate-binding protein [Desulfatibacillum aliphaticivorans]
MSIIRQLVLVFAVLAIGFGAYWASQTKERAGDAPEIMEKVRLAVPKGIITAPVLLAQSRGLFAEAGLDVAYEDAYSSGKTAFEAMLRGEADVSIVATTPVVANSFSRDDFFIFCTFTTSYEGVKVIARQDLGVKTASDLKGKTVGFVPGTISQLFLDSLLAYNRILPQEVNAQPIKPQNASALLNSGEMQAVSIWEPHAYTALKDNQGSAVKVPSSSVYRISICTASTKDFAAKSPNVLKKIILALKRTTAFMNDQPAQAQKELGKLINMDQEPLTLFWKETSFRLSLDQVLLMTMENEAAWMIANRYKDDRLIPDFTRFVYCAPLEEIDPQAVTIVRQQG